MFSFCYRKLMTFSKLDSRVASSRIFNKLSQTKRKFSTGSDEDYYKLRPMREEDIGPMIRLRREFTFQDSISCYEICYKTDPETFVIAADKDDRVVGFGSIRKNSDTLSIGGCLTIHPDYWKLGFGKKMIVHHLTRVGDRNTLIVTEAHFIPIYLPHFPILEKEYIIIDFESREEITEETLSYEDLPNTEIKLFHSEFLPAVIEFDRKVIGLDRKEEVILNCLDTYGITVVAVDGSKCVGYGSIKLNIQGAHKVGPLYAENPVVAEAILKRLLASFAYGKGLAVSIPSNNLDAIKLFGKLGKMKTINNYRMSNKERFILDTKPVYAIFDGEFHPF